MASETDQILRDDDDFNASNDLFDSFISGTADGSTSTNELNTDTDESVDGNYNRLDFGPISKRHHLCVNH